MKAFQSPLFQRMASAGINVTKHLITGNPIVFEGKMYTLKRVPYPK